MKKPTLVRLGRIAALLCATLSLPALAAPALLVPYTGVVPKAERKEFASEGARMKLNVGAIESLAPGEALDLTLPNGKTWAVVFDSVENKGHGVKSFVGYLRDTPDHLRVILTTGPGGTFGNIITPDGEFRLLPGQGYDWLVDMKAEGPHVPDVNLGKDYVRPPAGAPRPRKVEPAAAASSPTDSIAAATTAPVAKTTPSVVTVDMLVVYSPGYATRLGANLQTRIAQLITSANTYFADSQVGIRLRLVNTVQASYSDASAPNDNVTALYDISPINGPSFNAVGNAAFNSIETLRAQYGADLVTFLRSNGENALSGAGIAWAPDSTVNIGWKPYMYSVVTGCTGGCDWVWAHEVGHNAGNMHDRATVAWQQGGVAATAIDQGATPYAYGYYNCGGAPLQCNPNLDPSLPGACAANQQPECSTGLYPNVYPPGGGTNNISDIMAYFHYSTTRNLKFSNPNLTCSGATGPATLACGASELVPATSANTALSMNNQRVALSQMMPTMVPDVPAHKAKVDFNGDGMGDLAWANAGTGVQSAWLMNGAAATSSSTESNGTGVVIRQVGDFDGDGKTDIVWRSAVDGSYSMTLMNGLTAGASTPLIGGHSGWEIVDKGDFNGDGKTDLLWTTSDGSGSYGIWLMNGTATPTYGVTFYGGSGWTIKLVADFNGDGKSDLLGVAPDGSMRMWLMDGYSGWAAQTLLPPGSTWAPVLAADFNGDGKADLLLRNSVDGSYGIWLMSGTTIAGYGYVFYANNGITITHAVDLDGDGKADLVGTMADGTVRVWTMNGISGTAAANIFAAGTGWTPVYSDDFNGDGKADLLLHNVDGRFQVNLMNGTSVISSTTLPGTAGLSLTP